MFELLIVIAIVGVLAAVGTPWLLAMKTNSGIRADARDVHSTYRQAQSEAVKRGDIACVYIDENAGTYQIQIADYFGTIEPGESTYFQSGSLRPGNSFTIGTLDYFSCYNFRGLPTESGWLDISNRAQTLVMRVEVSTGGHVSSGVSP